MRIEVNNKNATLTYDVISEPSFTYSDDKTQIIAHCPAKHYLIPGNDIIFNRNESSHITYVERVKVSKIINDYDFSFDAFKDIQCESSVITPFTIIKSVSDNGKDTSQPDALFITLKDYHYHRSLNGSKKLRCSITPPYTGTKYSNAWPGDYYVFNQHYMYNATSPIINGKYDVDNDEMVNEHDIDVYFYDNNGEKVVLSGCIIPLGTNALERRDAFIWPNTDSIIWDYLTSHQNITFYFKDVRFLSETYMLDLEGNILSTDLFPYASLYISQERGSYNISIPFQEQFDNNINQENITNINYAMSVMNNNILDVVDYEKQRFEPMYERDGKKYPIRTMSYFLHLLERNIDDEGNWSKPIYSEENTTNQETHLRHVMDEYSQFPDMLGEIGFTDDDVYFRKNTLSKTFIRLMFYDLKDPKRQSLLFYANIFFNKNKLYTKYMKNVINDNDTDVVNDYKQTDSDLRLDARFECADIFTYDGSSEGLYLYLFPSIIESTNGEIFMKVEFNHAKFGNQIPLICPEVDATQTGFTIDYMSYENVSTESNAQFLTSTNMKKLVNDTYVPIKIEYDENLKKYIWSIENKNDENVVFHLYEPKIG